MALGNPADIGYGTTLTTLMSSYQITDMSLDGFGERSVVDISSSTSTASWRIFLPGDLKSGGSMSVEFNLLTNALATYKTIAAATKAAATITFPIPTDGGTSAGTIAMGAFVTTQAMTMPLDDRMANTATVQFSGEPTMVDAT